MVCAHCRQGISGRFLRVGKLAYHPEHFLCRQCQRPIDGQFNVHRGAFYHPACFEAHHAPRCAICEQPITGKYVVHEGRNLHQACYGKHLAVTCVVCRRGIVGTSLTDYWGNVYHAEHAREYATCLYCGKLCHPAVVEGGGVQYQDGRAVCRGCHRTAVHRDGDALRTIAAVRARMAGWGVDLDDIEVPVRMVDRLQLARLMGRGHAGIKMVSGLASMNWQREGRQVKHKQATIYLLSGMPLQWLEATAAHELMHVWNFHHGPPHAFEFEEGACNYMSYRIHLERGDEMAKYHIDCLMKDPHPAYGAGFRRVKRYVDRHGFGRLLTLLQRSRDFPLLDAIF